MPPTQYSYSYPHLFTPFFKSIYFNLYYKTKYRKYMIRLLINEMFVWIIYNILCAPTYNFMVYTVRKQWYCKLVHIIWRVGSFTAVNDLDVCTFILHYLLLGPSLLPSQHFASCLGRDVCFRSMLHWEHTFSRTESFCTENQFCVLGALYFTHF